MSPLPAWSGQSHNRRPKRAGRACRSGQQGLKWAQGMGVLPHEARVVPRKSTWWQSGRLQHAELGKSAPATRAGGTIAGLHSGSKSCSGPGGGGHPVPLQRFCSQSPQSLSEKDSALARYRVVDGGTGQPGTGGIHSNASALSPSQPTASPQKFPLTPQLLSPPRQHGQLGGCYLMPTPIPNRPKPDAGHLGHLCRPAPIPPWKSTPDGPRPVCRSRRRVAQHPTIHVLKAHPLPSLTSSQRSWPRKLSSRVLCMPVPELPPGLPVPLRTLAGAARRRPGGPSSGALALCLVPRFLALRSSSRRGPNIWQQRPAPDSPANGAGAGLKWPRPSGPARWVIPTTTTRYSPALWEGAGLQQKAWRCPTGTPQCPGRLS